MTENTDKIERVLQDRHNRFLTIVVRSWYGYEVRRLHAATPDMSLRLEMFEFNMDLDKIHRFNIVKNNRESWTRSLRRAAVEFAIKVSNHDIEELRRRGDIR
jgi:hypothetical protein